MRPRRHPARGRAGRDGHDGATAPPLRPHRRGDLRRQRARPARRPRRAGGATGRARGAPAGARHVSSRCSRSWPPRACASCSAASPRSRSSSWPTTATATGKAGPRPTRWSPVRGATMASDLTLSRAAPPRRPAPVAAAGRSPGTVVLRRTARKAARSGLLWGAVFGVYVATGTLTYASSYKTLAQRERLVQLFGSNVGLSALVGPARRLQTVAGYTAWKYLVFVSLIGAVWGLLTGTRLLRGEEDAGRWELLLAGQTTRGGAAAQALAGLAAGALCLWGVTALFLVAVGRSAKVELGVGQAAFFALALVASAVMFLAVGALAGQLAATRRAAAAYAAAALGVSYALRLIADSGVGLEWLRWLSPLGWVEELRPLTGSRPFALVPMAVLTGALAVATVVLAAHRDLGAATLPDRTSARPRTRLLGSPLGLAVRLVRPTVVAWAVAVAALGLLFGVVAKSAEQAITSSPTIAHTFDQARRAGGRCDGLSRRDLSHGGPARGPDRRRTARRSARRRGPGQARAPARAAGLACGLAGGPPRRGRGRAAGERPAGRPLRLAGSRKPAHRRALWQPDRRRPERRAPGALHPRHRRARAGHTASSGHVCRLRPAGLVAARRGAQRHGERRATGCSTPRCSTRCRPRRPWRPIGRAPRHSPPWARSPRRSAVSPSCAAIWPGSE